MNSDSKVDAYIMALGAITLERKLDPAFDSTAYGKDVLERLRALKATLSLDELIELDRLLEGKDSDTHA